MSPNWVLFIKKRITSQRSQFFSIRPTCFEWALFLQKKQKNINNERNREYLSFSVSDRFLFHRMNTKSSIFTSEKITFVFMSEIKTDLTLNKSNFLFLLCFKIAIITCKFIPMRQQSRQRNSFFSSHFT